MSTLLAASIPLDTDGTLAANSDSRVATQKATKTYADTKGVVDGQQIFDGSHVLAANFGQRKLYDDNGSNILKWTADGLLFLADLIDNDGFPTFNSLNRQLIASDGSTVALDWSDPSVLSVPGTTSFSSPVLMSSSLTLNDELHDANGNVVGATGASYRHLSSDGNTYFDNTGFHGIGSVIAGTKTATGTATTTFTVTIGVTMANTSYKVVTEGDNALSSAVHYVNNKTTTTFDVVYLAGLTGSVSFDWIVTP